MKKRLVFTLLCIAFFYGNAQNNSYYNRMQHVFGSIDKTKVTTGYLKEFGIRFNEVEAYNGTISATNLVDKTQWQSLYSSLYTMRVGTIAQNMTAPGTVFNTLKTQQAATTNILLAAQYYNFQQYKTNAVSNGDVTVSNDRIYDVTGRNPYDTKTVFGVAPLKKQLQGDTFNFKLPSSLVYTNTGLTLSQVQVDFDNGNGYQTITLNTAKTVSYTTGGEKKLKVKFVYSGGPTLYSHSKIWVDYIASQSNPLARFDGGNANTEVIIGDVWQGTANAANVTIELAPGHTQLTKPIIVVEGFDPDGSFDYDDLINEDDPGGLDIRISEAGQPILTLNDAIEDEGYDLVFIDFVNGTDFIQRNALVVQAVIDTVNTRKAVAGSTEKNVVMGMSMGGLIARYALRDMEINSEIHDTKLYISHDAPHQGANIPIAYQAFVRHLIGEGISLPVFFSLFSVNILDIKDIAPDLELGQTLLQSPAAQQMLLYQLQGTGGNVSVNNSTLHDSFITEYSNMGYPRQNGIRNIAIANGSECGAPLGFENHATLFDVNETIDLPYVISFLTLGTINALSVNPLKFISTVFSTNTDIKAKFNLKALPSLQSKNVYTGKIYIRKAILGFIIIHEDLIDEETINSSSTMLPLDNANGGIYDINELVTLPADLDDYLLEDQFNFIPTFSSLDIGGGNQTINVTDLAKAYSPLSPPRAPKDTPFDNFFSNDLVSEQHIQFTPNNGNWLMDELRDTNAFYSCASTCPSDLLSIKGKDQICTFASENYKVNNLAPNINVNWSISPSSSFSIAPSGSNNVIVTSTGGQSFKGTLTASINTDCGVFEIKKTIQIGTSSVDSVTFKNGIGEEGYFCTSHNKNTYKIYPKIKGASYQYRLLQYPNLNVVYTSSVTSSSSGTIYYTPSPGWYAFEARITDDCGTSYWTGNEVEYVDCSNSGGGGGEHRFAVYPNPSSSELHISEQKQYRTATLTSEKQDIITSVKVYGFTGNVVLEKKSGSLKHINVSRLKAGMYYLEITSNENVEVHRIIIEK